MSYAQVPKFWTTAMAPTSVGTGVTATVLNGGNAYSMTSLVRSLIEVTPEVTITAALTAAESLMIRLSASSDALTALGPKDIVSSYGFGGLSTFTVANAPPLKAYPYNTVFPGATTPVTFTGTAQIANTVAPEMALTLQLTTGGPLDTEQFYTAPTNETNTGTAAANVAGNDMTINGGRWINAYYSVLTPGVVTASESYEGRGNLTSSNFEGVPSPVSFHAQGIATALGSVTAVLDMGDRWYWKQMIPINVNGTVINTSFDLDEALTATGNFIIGAAFKKQ